MIEKMSTSDDNSDVSIADANTIDCVKLYRSCWHSNSGPLVCEASALPNELKGIPSYPSQYKRLVRTNTCNNV